MQFRLNDEKEEIRDEIIDEIKELERKIFYVEIEKENWDIFNFKEPEISFWIYSNSKFKS